MIKTIPMYQVVCDEPDCGRTAQDGGEFVAWTDPGAAIDEAVDAGWYIRHNHNLDLCPDCGYRSVCMGNYEGCARRDVTEADDGWVYCPEHNHEGMDS